MIIYWLKHRGTSFPIHSGECLLGRSPHCLVVLSAQRVSREHARIYLENDELTIVDLRSRNGTLVNGTPISGRAQLRAGDVIAIGDERLEVMQRVSREIPVTVDARDEEEPSLLAQRNVLELAEELLLRGSESGERRLVAQTIHTMVDALVRSTERSGCCLPRGQAVRAIAVAQVASRWVEDNSLEAWCQDVTRQLSA